VSASHADGGVMNIDVEAHDPSVRFAATSPAKLGRNELSHTGGPPGSLKLAPFHASLKPFMRLNMSTRFCFRLPGL
jgi:hypothetical protein